MVYEDGVHARIQCTGNVCIQVIPYHDAVGKVGTGFMHGKFKNFLFRLHTITCLGCNDVCEEMMNIAIGDFAPLCFFKTVGDEVELVIFFCQVLQYFQTMGKEVFPGWQNFEEVCCDFFESTTSVILKSSRVRHILFHFSSSRVM